MNYEEFKAEIFKLSGINLTMYKEKQMKRRIDALILKHGYNSSYIDYVKGLKADTDLYNEFINYLTINVSEFYRNPEQWEVLKNEVFPLLLDNKRTQKIWSSACSTGEEPYTLVMSLADFMPLNNIKILASDIDKEALRKAKAGIYNEKSLDKLPHKYILKYFDKAGDSYIVKDEVKNRVEFMQHNLLKDPYPDNCDLIICRNVLIYFTEEAKHYVYRHFNKAMKANGVLFVGSTEQIIAASSYCFTPLKTFFYKKTGEIS